MQAYTEEDRAVLAGLCRIEIKRWKAASESNPNMRYMVELMDTALAALTTEPVTLPDDGLDDCIRDWPDQWRNDFDTGYNYASWRYEQEMEKAGVKFTRDDF